MKMHHRGTKSTKFTKKSSRKVTTTDLLTASPTPLGPGPGLRPLCAATTPARKPKMSVLISPTTRSGICASAVKLAKYEPGVPPCTITLKT